MAKKRKVTKELRNLVWGIKILFLLVFLSGLIFLYSYDGSYADEKEKTSYFQLASQKLNVFVKVNEGGSPIILSSENNTYVCEGKFMDYPILVLDFSENIPNASLSITNPFYILFFSKVDKYTNEYRIVSPVLTKADAGGVNNGWKNYSETIFMSSGKYIASKNLNLTVIEINNPPVIENIGVKTIWNHGNNNIFDYQVNATDLEDGDFNNLIFNISFADRKLFNISSNGNIYFRANLSDIGVYNISVCVKDRGILNPHSKILSECGQEGGSMISCNNFSLTVTDKNRPPEIINYTPANRSIRVTDESDIFFNITSYDPDGTLVDVYWYVDDGLKKYDSQKDKSSFSFSYICGYSGLSIIKAVITDGEFNDSMEWNVSVNTAACPSSPPPGGGGRGVACSEKWVCEDWSECKNLKEEFNLGKTSYKVNTLIGERCSSLNWVQEFCGFQTRQCQDLKKCRSNLTIPPLMQECYFVLNPGCADGIKNCHNGSCEIGIDCGGNCSPCPTCSDGIKNQDEIDVDCGGVCGSCSKEIPKSRIDFFKFLMYFSLIFLILALAGIAILGTRYIFLKKKLNDVSNEDSENKESSPEF